ncbi:MAG: GTP-binding protein, partial [Alteromonadaceae bacterium]|nr:GTP-binding protein [Alteromonadaceae bacterium]
FVTAIMELLQRPVLPEHIVIEASGVGDPRVIAEVAKLHPQLFRDMVIVMVDAQTIQQRATDARLADTVELQLQSADLLVLNKIDLVSDEEREPVQQWLAGRAPGIPIVPSEKARFSLEFLFSDLKKGSPAGSDNVPVDSNAHSHDHVFASVTLFMEQPVNLERFREALAMMPDTVLRAKGFVSTSEPESRVFSVQLAGRHVDVVEQQTSAKSGSGGSAMVFIGLQGMPEESWFRTVFMAAQEPGQ